MSVGYKIDRFRIATTKVSGQITQAGSDAINRMDRRGLIHS